MLSKEDRSFLAGTVVAIATASVLVLLGYDLLASVAIALILGVVAGLLADKSGK